MVAVRRVASVSFECEKRSKERFVKHTAAAHLNGVEESNRTAASLGGRLKNKKREKEKKGKKDAIRYDTIGRRKAPLGARVNMPR